MGDLDDPLLECSFLIPVRRDASLSDGKRHSAKLGKWLRNELFERFRGGTRAPGRYDGFYEDPDTGEPVTDSSHKYIVAIRASRVGELRDLLSAACLLFQQKCIYLSVAGKVEFVVAPGGTNE
jgi:hypothetical protein